jgi:CheY-like chemotaxis protein
VGVCICRDLRVVFQEGSKEEYEGMQTSVGTEAIEIGLPGVINFQRGGDPMECIIQCVARDFSDATVFTSDLRVSLREEIALAMFLPLERSPIKCTGRIIAHSRSEQQIKGREGYLAQILIDHMGRIDRRRLELTIIQRETFLGSPDQDMYSGGSTGHLAEVHEQLGDTVQKNKALVAEVELLRKNLAELEETIKRQKRSIEEAGKLDTYNILVVDDEVANINALERTLNALKRTFGHEYHIFSATSGEDALAIMEQNDIGFIIADQRMPGMTGVEFLERTLQEYPDTIRIILTAYTDEKLLMDAINRVHVHGYISKPWEPEEILAILREGLRRQEAFHSRMFGRTDRPGLTLD